MHHLPSLSCPLQSPSHSILLKMISTSCVSLAMADRKTGLVWRLPSLPILWLSTVRPFLKPSQTQPSANDNLLTTAHAQYTIANRLCAGQVSHGSALMGKITLLVCVWVGARVVCAGADHSQLHVEHVCGYGTFGK